MRPNDIKAHLKRQPFQPFRVFMTDGSRYDVRHPELMFVTHTEVVIGLDPTEDNIPERSAYCDPIHVVRIEPINGVRPVRKKKGRR